MALCFLPNSFSYDCLTKGFEVEEGNVDRAIQHSPVRHDNFTVTWKTKECGLGIDLDLRSNRIDGVIMCCKWLQMDL